LKQEGISEQLVDLNAGLETLGFDVQEEIKDTLKTVEKSR
jgi:hypothetical protein